MVAKGDKRMWRPDRSSTEEHMAGESSTGNTSSAAPEPRDSWENLMETVNIKTEPSSLVELKNPFHMRQMTLSSISSTSGQSRQTLSSQAAGTTLTGKYMTSASKSLDLLRLNIQSLINKEVDAVLQKYLDKFFQPAIENIRNNLGENSVTDDNIKNVCRQMLEDAKVQYLTGSQSRGSSPFSDSDLGSFPDFRIGRGSANMSDDFFLSPSPVVNYKRKESDTESEASQSGPKPRKKTVRAAVTATATSATPTFPIAVPSTSFGITGAQIQPPFKLTKFDNIRREGPKWDPNRIVKSTLFIMGARANKVLGFGQTRGRLYAKHPELLKYSGDAEDKEWLARQNLIPPTGGIAYLLLLEDVKELAESEEYRHNPNVLLNDLKGFEVPEFMLRKIRAFIAEARTDNREPAGAGQLNDVNDPSGPINYTVDCASVIMTPPATVLGSGPGTHCEPLDFMECPSSLLPTAHANDYLSSLGQNFLYDSITYCDGNRTSQTLLYSSTTTMSSSVLNVNNHSSLASVMASPADGENPLDTIE